MSIDAQTVRSNLARVHERISAAGGDPHSITVLAVTKGFGAEAPRAALAVGLIALGENYAQELAEKAAAIDAPGPVPEWHFIGRLQSNKIRLVADVVTCWQSVDRSSVVREIAKRAPGARILVQVNATGELQKGGCEPGEVARLVEEAAGAGLAVEGLMAVGRDGDETATGRAFAEVGAQADALGLEVRSMGMTADLEMAVRAGATMVRVGSALFGPRPPR